MVHALSAQVAPGDTTVVPFPTSGGRRPSLAAIVPFPVSLSALDTRDQSRTASISTTLSRVRSVLEPSLGVGPTHRRGRVSIERLLALRDYTHRTSTTRAIIACLVTPLPALLLAVAIECIPLAPPSLGWRHQGMFWMRYLLTSIAMVTLSGLGFKQLVGRALQLSMGHLFAIAVLAATLHVSFVAGVSALWTFPIPFLFVIGGIPFVMFEVGAAFAVVDVRALLAKVEGLKKRTEGINSVSSAVSMLFWIYPLYSVAFELVGPKYQVSLLLFLPIFKAQWKKRMCAKLTEVEDLIPMIMMFTIELFNSLYLTTCMQSSGSPVTTAVIILLDSGLGFIRMFRLHKRMAGLLADVQSIKTRSNGVCDLLQSFTERITDPTTGLNDGTVRIRGNGLEYTLSESSVSVLQTLVAKQERRPHEPAVSTGGEHDRTGHSSLNQDAKAETIALDQTLQFLFQCEFMVLAEYIECAIPLLYAVYLPMLRGLHNGQYFAHTRALTADDMHNALANIVVYGVLESTSLVVMMVWLQRHFGLSVLHVLAFVLDEHAVYVQSNVILQLLFALQFTVAHLGADFSFRFAWITDPSVIWWTKKP